MGSKKKVTEVPEEALATVPSAGALATVEDYGDDAGLGVGQTAAELTIPWLSLLQANSPAVKNNQPEGARGGLFMFNDRLVKNLVIQPAFIDRVFVVWRDREKGGGIVSRHAPDSAEVQDAVQRNGGSEIGTKESPLLLGEHSMFDTRYLYFNVLDSEDAEEVVGFGILAASKTKIKPVKAMNSTVKWTKGSPPLFATRWHLGSFLDQQKGGARETFYNIELKPFGGPAVGENLIPKGSGLYKAGRALFENASKGKIKVNYEAEGQESEGSDVPRDF